MLRSVLVIIINICNSTGRKSGRLEAIEAGEAAPDIPEDSDNLTSASKEKDNILGLFLSTLTLRLRK